MRHKLKHILTSACVQYCELVAYRRGSQRRARRAASHSGTPASLRLPVPGTRLSTEQVSHISAGNETVLCAKQPHPIHGLVALCIVTHETEDDTETLQILWCRYQLQCLQCELATYIQHTPTPTPKPTHSHSRAKRSATCIAACEQLACLLRRFDGLLIAVALRQCRGEVAPRLAI